MDFINVSQPVLAGNERKYVLDALDRNQIAFGDYNKLFEHLMAEATGTRYAVSCSSGTASLILALKAIGIKPGDKVAVPAMTYIATANAATLLGATVVPVDVDPETWLMNPRRIPNCDYSAIIPVHLFGVPCDMDAIEAVLYPEVCVIEDAAEAHGAEYRNMRVGGIGHIGCFSFYGNKIVTTGEGGMMTTNNRAFWEEALGYRDTYHDTSNRYSHTDIGMNLHMNNISAAIGAGQAEMLDWHVQRRRELHEWYVSALSHLNPVTFQKPTEGSNPVWWMNAIQIEGADAGKIIKTMDELHVETRPFFVPIPDQTPYRHLRSCPIATELYKRGICLPTHSNMTENDVDMVADRLKKAIYG